MHEPFLKQDRLNRMKQEAYLREAEGARLAAQVKGPGLRWRVAQGLLYVAARLSPESRVVLQKAQRAAHTGR